MLTDQDERMLRRSFDVARRAHAHGNEPFGAVLVGPDGTVLAESGNSVVTDRDVTAHAETNLVRIASRISADILEGSTMYASTEPCPMCAAAIFWAGIGRVVYGLSSDNLYRLLGETERRMGLGCAEVLAATGRSTEVIGPALEDEAAAVIR